MLRYCEFFIRARLSSACSLGAQGSYGPDRIVHAGYDAADRPTASTEGYGTATPRTTATGYTANGLPDTLTDARGNLTTYVRDGFDRLTRIYYPSPSSPGTSSATDYDERTYDAASNVVALRTRAGDAIALTYDALDRLVLKDLPGGAAEDVQLAYDNLGHLTSALYAGSGSGVTQAWDALGRMTSQATFGRTLSYQYDLASNRTRLTWPDGTYATYAHDALYRTTAIGVDGGQVLTFAYDALERRSGIGRANGVTTTYAYDAVSRLASLVQNVGGGGYSAGLAYTPASQLRAQARLYDAQTLAIGTDRQNPVSMSLM